ncbi:MAG: hypothetical protein IJ809_02315 [Clostridia bacterium]|nr:hypothetical protein [Clostridia bacterium]
MEKKVNLTIFFNYRHYSPKFKLLLEDVFYKKMHDEKISGNDAMKEVMEFCNDIDEIEYKELDSEVLSRFDKEARTIYINTSAVSSLIELHKDLDEDALLKNILQRQVQNILSGEAVDNFEVTFEDILNKNGYVSPRKLSEMVAENPKLDDESKLGSIVSQKSIQTPAVQDYSASKKANTSDFSQTMDIQNALKGKLDNKKNGFKNFFPEPEEESASYNNNNKQNAIQEEVVDEDEKEDNFELIDCIKRKDDDKVSSGSSFSDFVSKNNFDSSYNNFDYSLDDEVESNKEKSKKGKSQHHGSGFFKSMKEKVSSFKDKVKSGISKHEDDEEYEDFDSFNNKEEVSDVFEGDNEPETQTGYDYNYGYDFEKTQYDLKSNYEESALDVKEEVEEEPKKIAYNDIPKVQTPVKDTFDYDINTIEDDFALDSKFDSIIDAIMKEKQLDEYDQKISDSLNSTSSRNVEENKVEEEKASIYDSFAEELETVESIRRRRRR